MDMRLPEHGGDPDTALYNYFLFQRQFGVRDGRVVKQVHGDTLVCADGLPRRPLMPTVIGEGDAVWTSEHGIWVGVFTADCLAVLLDAGERVMAVHAGWRGLAAGILAKAVDFLGGGSAIRSATLSPAAGGCCYEVGDEVPAAMRAARLDPVMTGRKLDLPLTAMAHLTTLGVREVHRVPASGCSICTPGLASFRRDGARAGRNLSVIARSEDD